MAVLAPQDWHPPRDHTMDAPSSNSSNHSLPRQRSSPPNDHSASPSPISHQQPYPYPVQQQQAGWNPAQQQQFYPAFYQNPHQQPYPLHGSPHSPPGQLQSPYYDPTNAQFAQWAYQQMMFNAHQAHQMSHVPSSMSAQRNRAGSASTGSDYYPQGQMPSYNPFPTGTPPVHPSQLPNGYPAGQGDLNHNHQPSSQYSGFHPYRRPTNRQPSHTQDSQQTTTTDWRSAGMQPYAPNPIQPSYVKTDPAASSTSVNSGSNGANGARPRTNSNQGGANGATTHSHPKAPSSNGHGRIATGNANGSSPSNAPPQRPHHRTNSASSNNSSSSGRPSPAAPISPPSSTTSHPAVNLRRPSPLSQGNFTAAEKRMSRDDSDLTAMLEPTPGVRSSGLKGRLRRALSLNAGATLQEEAEEDVPTKGKSSRHVPQPSTSQISHTTIVDDDESTATVQKKKSRSLFNSRFNRSTDNISLSSTMSSASMVIRKLGSIGKLARRNSLAGITSLFKDKDKKEGEEGGGSGSKKSKKKKGEKGSASEASVSHATAEFEPGEWSADMPAGLSPAAMLARQHTLKSNAEAAAKAKAEAEAKAAAAAAAAQNAHGENVPATWEKGTTNRQGESSGHVRMRVNEDGMRVVVEDDDSDSDDGHHQHPSQSFSMGEWDDDEDWEGAQNDEDDTIRAGLGNTKIHDQDEEDEEEDVEMEPWAINVRRSIERAKVPAKGILKTRPDGQDYQQDAYLPQLNPPFARNRSNSYDSPAAASKQTPLAHIPSPDPLQIDGIHKNHPSTNGGGGGGAASTPFLPPLEFETDSPKDASDSNSVHTITGKEKEKEKTFFSLPNSSAPALSTVFSASGSSNPPTLTQRSATAPAKRLAFATNLSVYDTFPATVYDRRSEPATWSRLTPALAQRIKEELNSYKMEEMEVHASSRIHTQFFV